MDKKGAIISLEALIKFVPVLLVAIVGLYVLFSIWGAFFQENMPASGADLIRVKNNLASIGPNDKISVFTMGKEYMLYLYSEETSPAVCGKTACLCVHDKIEGNYVVDPSRCELLSGVSKCAGDNKNGVCFSGTERVEIKNTDPKVKEFVTVCKNNGGKMSIEGKC